LARGRRTLIKGRIKVQGMLDWKAALLLMSPKAGERGSEWFVGRKFLGGTTETGQSKTNKKNRSDRKGGA